MLDRLVMFLPAQLRDKAKAVAASLGALLGIVVLVWPDAPRWLTTVVAVATALGVYAVPNLGYDSDRDPGPGPVSAARLRAMGSDQE